VRRFRHKAAVPPRCKAEGDTVKPAQQTCSLSVPPEQPRIAATDGNAGAAGEASEAVSATQRLFLMVRDEEEASVLEALMDGIRDPKSRFPPEEQDLMFFAAARRHSLGGAETIARRLHELGVPGNTVDRLGQTALFFAAREGNEGCASFLTEQGCEVNHRDIYGQTPLFYSVRERHLDMCRQLIHLGASLVLRDHNKRTATFYAKGEEAAAFAEMVSSCGHPNPDGRKAPKGEKAILACRTPNTRARSSSPPATRAAVLRKRSRRLRPVVYDIIDSAEDTSSPVEIITSPRKLEKGKEPLCPDGGQKSALEVMTAWALGSVKHCRESHGEVTPNSRSALSIEQPLPEPEKIVARAGEYYVCFPRPDDVARLRHLEREFVLDHCEVFQDEPWHRSLDSAGWCHLVNVIEGEERAQQAILSIVAGKTMRHNTLQCVHAPVDGSPQVVGYIHVVTAGSYLDVSHLKVERGHQRRGLGSLLIAGIVRWALQSMDQLRDLRLIVMQKNTPALALYHALGFQRLGMVRKKVSPGAGIVEWQKMWRSFSEIAPGAFARICEARVSTSQLRGGPALQPSALSHFPLIA